jgi:hypothetical protein
MDSSCFKEFDRLSPLARMIFLSKQGGSYLKFSRAESQRRPPRLPAGTLRIEGGEDIGIYPQPDVLRDWRFPRVHANRGPSFFNLSMCNV